MTDSTFEGNGRGGIWNGDTLTVSDSTFEGNSSLGFAGMAGGKTERNYEPRSTKDRNRNFLFGDAIMLLFTWRAMLKARLFRHRRLSRCARRRRETRRVDHVLAVETLEDRCLLSVVASPLGGDELTDAFGAGNNPHGGPRGLGTIPGQYIVTLRDDVDVAAFADEMRGQGRDVLHTYSHAFNGLAFRGPAPGADPRIAAIEPDGIVHATGELVSTEIRGLESADTDQIIPTGVSRIGAADPDALGGPIGTGKQIDIDIAILDTGIDHRHSDLNVVGGVNFAGGPEHKWRDDNGHGSHVAGTAAALDNGSGVVGVAPGARLWSVKVLGMSGSGTISGVIAGVDWVTAHADTIDVANMSLGGSPSLAMDAAISNSVQAGVFYVVSAGNNGDDAGKYSPARSLDAATISAMVDTDGEAGGEGSDTSWGPDDSFATFSNFSPEDHPDNPVVSPGARIDLLMPGVDILSTYLRGNYATMSGTSMAAPHAAGLAALYIAEHFTDDSGQINRDYNGDGVVDEQDVYFVRQALIDGGVAQDSSQGLAHLNDPDDNWENIGWAVFDAPEVTDVAITSLTAPESVLQGDLVSIDVTVENTGNQDVATDIVVTLLDETDEFVIGTQTIPGGLVAGASETLTFSWDTSDSSLGDRMLTAIHDFEDDQPDNNSKSTVVAVETATTDIAIAAVNAPSSVVQGDVVSVEVIVENSGNQDVNEEILVSLIDETDALTIGTKTIIGDLAAGASQTLIFSWDTSDSSPGDYILTASHNFADDEPSNDSKSTMVAVSEFPVTEMYVWAMHWSQRGPHLDVTVEVNQTSDGTRAADDNPAVDASFTFTLTLDNGSPLLVEVATTDDDGLARFRLRHAEDGQYQAEVKDLLHEDETIVWNAQLDQDNPSIYCYPGGSCPSALTTIESGIAAAEALSAPPFGQQLPALHEVDTRAHNSLAAAEVTVAPEHALLFAKVDGGSPGDRFANRSESPRDEDARDALFAQGWDDEDPLETLFGQGGDGELSAELLTRP